MNKILVKRLLRKPAAWPACAKVILAMSMGRKEVTVRRQGVKLRTKLHSGHGLYCAVAGTSYEPEMSYFLNQMRPGDTFIDVGANIGNFSLHAWRRIQPYGKVYSFEPLQANFESLALNIRINMARDIEANKLAISDEEGSFRMHVPSRNSSASLLRVKGDVITETLDRFCALKHISEAQFIKVDIEGGELNCFRGAEQLLRRSTPVILFESMHSGPEFPERSFLKNIGFALYRLTGRAIEPLTECCAWRGNVIAKKV